MGASAIEKPAVRTPRKRNARRLDRKKALMLSERGLGSERIGDLLGVAPSTVWRFLKTNQPERQAIKTYVKDRQEVFQRIQAKALDVQARIIDSLDDRVLSALEPHQKAKFLDSINTVFGTIYDKERLEAGKSTQNVGLIARMMGDSLGRIGKATSNGGDPEPETPKE